MGRSRLVKRGFLPGPDDRAGTHAQTPPGARDREDETRDREVCACCPVPIRRILFAMSDAVVRLNAALEGRYAIERQLGEGGMAVVEVH